MFYPQVLDFDWLSYLCTVLKSPTSKTQCSQTGFRVWAGWGWVGWGLRGGSTSTAESHFPASGRGELPYGHGGGRLWCQHYAHHKGPLLLSGGFFPSCGGLRHCCAPSFLISHSSCTQLASKALKCGRAQNPPTSILKARGGNKQMV